MVKVLVFGVFDGLHKGHRYFLRKAKEFGDYLVVATPSDSAVKEIKNIYPDQSYKERVKKLKASNLVDEVVPSDDRLNDWGILNRQNPNIIALGYDQKELKEALKGYIKKTNQRIELKTIESFEPQKYKSSFFRKGSKGG